MGIVGAVLYSLALISGRELARFPSRANRALPWAWHVLLDSAARYGASLFAMPHGKSGQLDNGR
jgi:hypothetical protein